MALDLARCYWLQIFRRRCGEMLENGTWQMIESQPAVLPKNRADWGGFSRHYHIPVAYEADKMSLVKPLRHETPKDHGTSLPIT